MVLAVDKRDPRLWRARLSNDPLDLLNPELFGALRKPGNNKPGDFELHQPAYMAYIAREDAGLEPAS